MRTSANLAGRHRPSPSLAGPAWQGRHETEPRQIAPGETVGLCYCGRLAALGSETKGQAVSLPVKSCFREIVML